MRTLLEIHDTQISAVLCKDLYAKQIAEEKNGDSSDDFYTRSFDDGWLWICPNITSTITVDAYTTFYAEAITCKFAFNDTYA